MTLTPRSMPLPPNARSCTGAPGADLTCGLVRGDCCESRLVPGGSFLRLYDGLDRSGTSLPAKVSPFYLDSFEVTVGRFRAFVDAYPASKPSPGSGAHPKVPSSGWDGSWPLAQDKVALSAGLADPGCVDFNATPVATWTPSPGPNERLPIMCLTWYEAVAFCAWDGGRLPTLAELNFAQAGGDEQRVYPWTTTKSYAAIDDSRAVYRAKPPFPTTPLAVGSKPAGVSRWGQFDLSGNVGQLTLDRLGDPPTPCDDRAKLDPKNDGMYVIGGSWGSTDSSLPSGIGGGADQSGRSSFVGVRCVRDVR